MVLLLIDYKSEQNYVFEFKSVNEIVINMLVNNKFVKCDPLKIAN